MGNGDILRICLIAFLLLFSAFFSAAETAYSSMNRARIKTLADRGSKRAAGVLKLAERYDDLLSAILVGNNIVNIAMSSVGTLLFMALMGEAGATVSTAVITVVVLIFGEVTPKSLAKEMPEHFAMRVYPLVRFFMLLFYPVCRLFGLWKRLLRRVFHVGEDRRVTHEELVTLVEEAAQEGGIDQSESDLVKSAIAFSGRNVSDILTPRVHVEGVEAGESLEKVQEVFLRTGYSRLPVYRQTLDDIVGVVHEKELFRARAENSTASLNSLMTAPVYVPESTAVDDLLRLMQRAKSQLAVVTDEYGGTLGIVTMEDILEELVGEIWDEHDEIEEAVTALSDREWLVQGDMDVTHFASRFGIRPDTDASTVGGFVMELAERVPDVGECFTYAPYTFVIDKADERHVLAVRLRKDAAVPAGER